MVFVIRTVSLITQTVGGGIDIQVCSAFSFPRASATDRFLVPILNTALAVELFTRFVLDRPVRQIREKGYRYPSTASHRLA
jgi:hypothetical protein